MIALLLTLLAFADDSLFDNPKNQCSVDDSFPIAGTAGARNTLTALRTNAQTYSASAFAERHALRRIALSEAEQEGVAVAEFNASLGVARVPVYQDDALYGECPAEYVLGTRPVDVYAYNFGIAWRKGRIGAFYASSITLGYPGELAYLRAYQTFGSVVMLPALAPLVPLTGSFQKSTGASSYAQDFVAGVMVDAGLAHVRAGYTQSRGWYLSANDKVLGLFGSVVLRDGFSVVGQFRGGLERVKLPAAVEEKIGRPSAFARLLPLTEAIAVRDAAGEVTGKGQQVDLFTGHLEQEGIAGVLDLRGAYAVKPVARLHEASVALHARDFYALEDATAAPVSQSVLKPYVELGVVNVPDQYYLGLEGGMHVHLRGELLVQLPSREGAQAVSVMALFNDPEQVALYPFSLNRLSLRAQYRGVF